MISAWKINAICYAAAVLSTGGLTWPVLAESWTSDLPIGPLPLGMLIVAGTAIWKISAWRKDMEHSREIATLKAQHAAELRSTHDDAERARVRRELRRLKRIIHQHGIGAPDIVGDDTHGEDDDGC